MEDAAQHFYELLACIGMHYSNFDAALYCERTLKTDGRLQQSFYANRFGSFSRHTFLARGLGEPLVAQLFYPVPNASYVESVMQLHARDRPLTQFLVEQYHAQQVWHSYFEDYFFSGQLLTRDKLRALRKLMPPDFLKKCERVRLGTPHFFVPQLPSLSVAARAASAFQYLTTSDIRVDSVPNNPDSFFVAVNNQFRDALATDKQHLVSVPALRSSVQQFAETHFRTFVSVVQSWRDMYQYATQSDRQWDFYDPYRDEPNAIAQAKRMLKDRVLEDSRAFYADLFAIDAVVDALSNIFKRPLLLAFIDMNTEPSFSTGFLQDPSQVQWVSFMVKDDLQFYSMTVQNQRFFAANKVPPTNLPFLQRM